MDCRQDDIVWHSNFLLYSFIELHQNNKFDQDNSLHLETNMHKPATSSDFMNQRSLQIKKNHAPRDMTTFYASYIIQDNQPVEVKPESFYYTIIASRVCSDKGIDMKFSQFMELTTMHVQKCRGSGLPRKENN